MKENRSLKKDIAIVGLSGKFPQSDTMSEFWKHLTEGQELVLFHTDEELRQSGVSEELIMSEDYVKTSSRINDAGCFDYSFFGYTKEDAEFMEPQIRILHEQVWHSLENAGYNPSEIQTKVGCYFSAGDDINWRAHILLSDHPEGNSYLTGSVSKVSSISTLISYSLNLRGPSCYVDTACSSSLVAVHMACRSLLLKECGLALAGGVNVRSGTDLGYLHEKGMIYSKDGHCKAFDADSSGTFGGEGAGVIVLKRLEEAIADRDYIYAVIRSTSVNNDGKQKVGYTAPSVQGQFECIKTAQQIAGVSSESISYIEAHGTGTRLGDSVEIEALNKAFDYNTGHSCAIGSVKTNIGHLDAAAGIAGLLKATMAVKNRMIPASLHFESPNPEIDFKSGPFYVNKALMKWETDKPFIVGISSLGIGGTNAHIILGEAPAAEPGSPPNPYQLLLYSARTPSALEQYNPKLKEFLKTESDSGLADLAYTLKMGRNAFKYRKFIVCQTPEEAIVKMEKAGRIHALPVKEKRKVVFLFAGHGSQYFAMGKQIYLQYPYFRDIMDKGFEILKSATGDDYRTIIGYDEGGKEENVLINDTRLASPLVFLVEYAFARLLMHWGVEPDNMIGYSLGEYVAACISEVFSFEDCLNLVVKRAVLINSVKGGSMLSIGMSAQAAGELMTSDLSIAGINAAEACVVSGRSESIDALAGLLESKEISFSRIKTSHAFHSQMMDNILPLYEKEVEKTKRSAPKYAYLSCMTGEPITIEEVNSVKYWSRHLREPVNLEKGLATLLEDKDNEYVEIGPAKTVSNYLKQNRMAGPQPEVIYVLRHPKEATDDRLCLLNALGGLWAQGVDIIWKNYYEGEKRNRIPAPTYAFDKTIFTSRVDPVRQFNGLKASVKESKDPMDWIFEEGWKEMKSEWTEEQGVSDWTLCFLAENDLSQALRLELEKKNSGIIFVRKGIEYQILSDREVVLNPALSENYEKLAHFISNRFSGKGRIVHAWCTETPPLLLAKQVKEAEEWGYFSLLNLAKCLSQIKTITNVSITFFISDLFKITGNETIHASHALALGALRVIPKEYEHFQCRCIEFQAIDWKRKGALINEMAANLRLPAKETIIALRGNKAWKPFYEKLEISGYSEEKTKLKRNGLYLITGANGGMGKVIADYLVKKFNADLILIGRGDWKDQALYAGEAISNKVWYIKDDLADMQTLEAKIREASSALGQEINGVFHTAGVGDYSGLIKDRTEEDCRRIFSPKVSGTNNLFEALETYSPDFFVLFSSSASVMAPFGQIAYVAGNMYQNYFAQMKEANCKIVSIQWDAWKEVGMAVAAHQHHKNNKVNTPLSIGISNEEGMKILMYAIHSEKAEIIVSLTDLNDLIQESAERTLKKYMELAEAELNQIEAGVERPEMMTDYVEGSSTVEVALCELWKSVFGYEKIGICDDFFELGGDSLKAMTVLRRMHKMFNVEIGLGDFFNKSTIKELAKEIETAQEIRNLTGKTNTSPLANQIRL
jgi:phthiocerol/phenolphthiocerol synthesis type-I polyketide synthase E